MQRNYGTKPFINLLRDNDVRYLYGDGAPKTQILPKFTHPNRAPFQTLRWDMMDRYWHNGFLLQLSRYRLSTTPPTVFQQLRYLLTQTQHRQG